ncbi:MAG: hypothetical protein ACK56Y_04330, partial [Pseudanabaena sp.]
VKTKTQRNLAQKKAVNDIIMLIIMKKKSKKKRLKKRGRRGGIKKTVLWGCQRLGRGQPKIGFIPRIADFS